MSTPVSYDMRGAAAATGLSPDVIRRAMNAGELRARYVTANGRAISKPIFEHADLIRWVRDGATERPAP